MDSSIRQRNPQLRGLLSENSKPLSKEMLWVVGSPPLLAKQHAITAHQSRIAFLPRKVIPLIHTNYISDWVESRTQPFNYEHCLVLFSASPPALGHVTTRTLIFLLLGQVESNVEFLFRITYFLVKNTGPHYGVRPSQYPSDNYGTQQGFNYRRPQKVAHKSVWTYLAETI